MSTQVYEKLFLVNNIPKIEGMYQVRDLIKGYAYTGDMQMIRDMKRAKEHSKKFKYVNLAIQYAYSRSNLIQDHHIKNDHDCSHCENIKKDVNQQAWVFGFDRYEYDNNRSQHCYIADYDVNFEGKYAYIKDVVYIEDIQMQGGNCYLCGESIPYYVNHWYNIPYCYCSHNDHLYIEDEENPLPTP